VKSYFVFLYFCGREKGRYKMRYFIIILTIFLVFHPTSIFAQTETLEIKTVFGKPGVYEGETKLATESGGVSVGYPEDTQVDNGDFIVSGSIGIGTDDPAGELDVVGDIQSTGLTVNGDIQSNNLNVTGTIQSAGLTVNGTPDFENLDVAGHIGTDALTVTGAVVLPVQSITGREIADGTVTAANLNANVAGEGLIFGNNQLNVNVGAGLEQAGDQVRLPFIGGGQYDCNIQVDQFGRVTSGSTQCGGGGEATGTGSTNYVPLWENTSGVLTDSIIYQDPDNSIIGIGTGDNLSGISGTKLEAAGHIVAIGAEVSAGADASNRLYMKWANDVGNIQTIRNGSSQGRLILQPTSGRVGVGKDPGSNYELDVNGDINFTGNIYKSGSLFGTPATPLWTESGSDVYRSSGRVSIGTATPEFKLNLDDDGGIIAKGIYYYSGATLTTSGVGTRLIWYPRKAAFRAGYVSGSQWNDSNIGNYSVAMGRSTTASAAYSTALGDGTTASTVWATAMGNGTIASGSGATAMGLNTTASGSYSVAMGTGTTASGFYSLAVGDSTTASNTTSVAMGRRANASHYGCFVWADRQDEDYSSTAHNQFRIRASSGIFHAGSKIHDIAEFMDVLKKENVKEAEIVSLAENDKLGKSTGAYDENLIGVVSSKRTCTLHLADEESVYEDTIRLPIALAGRVYVKVNNEAGHIKVGDPITSSSLSGVGMKCLKTGKIIGYAMENEDFSDGEEIREILIFINAGYYISKSDYAKLSEIDDIKSELKRLERYIKEKK
ncbi:MAG: hypothetical protein JSV34_06800, partial [Candidatus Omnitrophota bacterium]